MTQFSLLRFSSKQTQLFERLSFSEQRLNIHLSLFSPMNPKCQHIRAQREPVQLKAAISSNSLHRNWVNQDRRVENKKPLCSSYTRTNPNLQILWFLCSLIRSNIKLLPVSCTRFYGSVYETFAYCYCNVMLKCHNAQCVSSIDFLHPSVEGRKC